MKCISKKPLLYKTKADAKTKKVIQSYMVPMLISNWQDNKPWLIHNTKGNNLHVQPNNEIAQNNCDLIYNFFVKQVSKVLKSFTMASDNSKDLWVYTSDKNLTKTYWHNHSHSSSVNGVFYFKCVKDKGIYFREDNNTIYIEPKVNDLYIFPGHIDHLPVSSHTDEIRISCNVELKCNESIDTLFNTNNLRTIKRN